MAPQAITDTKTLTSVRRYAREFITHLEEEGVPVQHAYLYGSHARGNAHAWSDIDVCIVSPKFKRISNPFVFLWDKRRPIDVRRGIEPVGYHPKDFEIIESPLVWDIATHGIKIR